MHAHLTFCHSLSRVGDCGLMVPNVAQACAVMTELSPQVVAGAPVIARGHVEDITHTAHGGAVLTFVVAETIRGEDMDRWAVFWSPESIVGVPDDLDEFAARYGVDLVIGLTPDLPEATLDEFPQPITERAGALAQEMCGEPFVAGYAEIALMLHDARIAE